MLQIIASEFLDLYQKIITSPGGENKVSVHAQVDIIVARLVDTDVDKLFDIKIGRCVYYVIGFLCNAGANETKRRMDAKNLGACIGAIDDNFARGREDGRVDKIKRELPIGLADLVDKRCSYGGLKYPGILLYTVFGITGMVFSSLATPKKITMFCRTLLDNIHKAMLENKGIILLFEDLFRKGKFSATKRDAALAYYFQVSDNVRAKDLCYQYNDNIYKQTT